MTLHTRLCDLLDVEHPVLNAPMGGGDAPGRLAAAVSEAGGLGLIGGTTRGGIPWLTEQIRQARELTERPFGVGLIAHLPGADALLAAALDAEIRVIAVSFADPTPFVGPAHDAGAVVLCQVRTVEDARRAAAAGVDVVAAQGTEAGGHTGRVSTLPLVPAVVDAVAPTPVVAAGGIADGRGVAAALMLGAEGAWIGTRFIATIESGVSEAYRSRVIASDADDTVLTEVFDIASGMPWPEGVAGRAITNDFAERWHGRENELHAWSDEHREQYLAREPGSDVDQQPVWAGEGSSFVTRVMSAGAVVQELVADATEVLEHRPGTVLRAANR